MTALILQMPNIISSPRAFYRWWGEMGDAAEARRMAQVPDAVPSSLAPESADDYWGYLAVGLNLDVRL